MFLENISFFLWDSYGLLEIPTTGGIMATLKSNQSISQGRDVAEHILTHKSYFPRCETV
jgi:hypothetical protein